MQIRLFKPSVGEEELEAIREVFERAWLGLGPKVVQFEQEWSAYVGVKASLAVNSCTAAMHLALAAYRFRPGMKVLVPTITFVSTALAPLYNRLEPVFVDVEPETLSIDLEDLERKITPDCVAVMPVHLGGHPVPMDRLVEIAKAHSLVVIEDCAHCAGGAYKGKKLGSWGDIGCFSFEDKKCMTTGDGGMICSDQVDLIEAMRPLRWLGIDREAWKRAAHYTDPNSLDSRHWYYEAITLGYKYNMNDLTAAIGLAQLKKLDRLNARRRALIQRYLEGIQGLSRIRPLLPYALDEEHAYWIFGVRCEQRDELILHLKRRGIATAVHFIPLPHHPLFRNYSGEVPVANKVWQTMVTLPLFPDLTDEQVDSVVEALHDFERSALKGSVQAQPPNFKSPAQGQEGREAPILGVNATPRSPRIVLLANRWAGWQVCRWLREQNENLVGLVLHPPETQLYGEAIISASGLPPERIRVSTHLHEGEDYEWLCALQPDVLISVWYGYLLKPTVLQLPPMGCLNLHPAYLPYNRGKFPNVWSIVEGTPAGATLHYMDEGVDTGDLIHRKLLQVEPTDTGETLYHKLERLAIEVFQEAWPSIKAGTNPRIPQATLGEGTFHYARDVERIDAIDLEREYKARDLINLLRARTFPPYPAAYFVHEGKRIYLRLQLIEEDQLEKDYVSVIAGSNKSSICSAA